MRGEAAGAGAGAAPRRPPGQWAVGRGGEPAPGSSALPPLVRTSLSAPLPSLPALFPSSAPFPAAGEAPPLGKARACGADRPAAAPGSAHKCGSGSPCPVCTGSLSVPGLGVPAAAAAGGGGRGSRERGARAWPPAPAVPLLTQPWPLALPQSGLLPSRQGRHPPASGFGSESRARRSLLPCQRWHACS